MATEQPEWELIGNLGDVNVADYGGFLVYRDKTGVYPAQVEMYEPNTDKDYTGGMMYRFDLDPPRFKTLYKGRSYNPAQLADPQSRGVVWHWHKEWFVDKLPEVAKSTGTMVCQLLRDLFNPDPLRKASAYRDIVGHFGPFEFDQYPIKLTEDEAQERYKDVS